MGRGERSKWTNNLKFGANCDLPGGPVAKLQCCKCKGLSVTPGRRTRSHMLQLKTPRVATKTCYSQKNT